MEERRQGVFNSWTGLETEGKARQGLRGYCLGLPTVEAMPLSFSRNSRLSPWMENPGSPTCCESFQGKVPLLHSGFWWCMFSVFCLFVLDYLCQSDWHDDDGMCVS